MTDTDVVLPEALGGHRHALDTAAWPLSFYLDDTAGQDAPPLLLIHSVNAAASAYEVRPIYEHFHGQRTVAALDLPGFGFSARHAKRYTPRLMADAIQAMVDHLLEITGHDQVDVLACSVACEYVARAAKTRPAAYRSLAFVSPAGFDKDPSKVGPRAYTRGRPWLYRLLTQSSNFAAFVFRGLASEKSIRFFLEKTWGEKAIDEGVFDYAWKTAHQPGARHAPFSFLSGYLFSADAADLYRDLAAPIWLAYGTKSDFTDETVQRILSNHDASTQQAFDAGALPHFQKTAEFMAGYEAFLGVTSQ
tara:strand:- start:26 stop:940 length:915 start_codon:yes stop_codon:yes gene_type:complete